MASDNIAIELNTYRQAVLNHLRRAGYKKKEKARYLGPTRIDAKEFLSYFYLCNFTKTLKSNQSLRRLMTVDEVDHTPHKTMMCK